MKLSESRLFNLLVIPAWPSRTCPWILVSAKSKSIITWCGSQDGNLSQSDTCHRWKPLVVKSYLVAHCAEEGGAHPTTNWPAAHCSGGETLLALALALDWPSLIRPPASGKIQPGWSGQMFWADRWGYTGVTNVFKCQAIESEVEHIGCSSDRAQVTCWCVLLTDRPTFHIEPLPTNPPVLHWTLPSPSCVTSLPELSSNSPPLEALTSWGQKLANWSDLRPLPFPLLPVRSLEPVS